MTKLRFEELLYKFKESKMTLKSFLKAEGVTYSTFKYWNDKKKEEENQQLPLAPIEFRESGKSSEMPQTFYGVDVPGVTLLLPQEYARISVTGVRRCLWMYYQKS